MILEDGTGSGKKGKVNDRNHTVTSSVIISEEVFVALESSLSFSVSSGILTIPASFSGPILMVKNLDSNRDVVAGHFGVVIDAPSAGATVALWRNPTVGALAANVAKQPVNLNFESGILANVDSQVWDNVTGLAGITGITAAADGVFGPTIIGPGGAGGGPGILGQNSTAVVVVTSGAAGFECTVSASFYFDTTGAK